MIREDIKYAQPIGSSNMIMRQSVIVSLFMGIILDTLSMSSRNGTRCIFVDRQNIMARVSHLYCLCVTEWFLSNYNLGRP